MSQQTENSMRKIFLSKVVLNMGVGKSGDPIEIGKKTLIQITGKKPNPRNAKKSQRDWGVRKGEPIGVAVTVRKENAITLLKKLLEAKDNQIKKRSFDNEGNFSFGITEHIDIPGVKYNPKIGILGLEVSVSLTRPGYSVRLRSKHKSSVGKNHKISKQNAIDFMKENFEVAII